MAPDIEGFDHIHVFVEDRAAAEAWYARVFGFRRTPELEFWAVDGGPLTIQNDSGSIHLALFESARTPCRSTIAMRVTADAFTRWRGHLDEVLPGGARLEDHEASLSLYFSDPDGNPYEITTYDHAAAKAVIG